MFFHTLTKGVISTYDPNNGRGLISFSDGAKSLAVKFDVTTFSDFAVDGFYAEWRSATCDTQPAADRYVLFDERELTDNTVLRWTTVDVADRAMLAAKSQNFVVIRQKNGFRLWSGTVTLDGLLLSQYGKRFRKIPEGCVLKRSVRDETFTGVDGSTTHFGGLIDVDEPEATWLRILQAKLVRSTASV